MATANTTAVRVALDGVVEAERALRRLGPAGEDAFNQLRSGASKASGALESIGTAANQNQGRYKQLGEGIRQAGFQFGDFAVQVQSGTNVIVAGTQQLSQFAGAFGVYGAAVGGLLAVGGALVSYFTRQNEVTAEGTPILEDFVSAMSSAEGQAKTYADALAGASEETRKLIGEFAKLDQAQIAKTAKVPAAGISEELRGRLNEAISANITNADVGLGADAAVAGVKARIAAIEEVGRVQKELEAAVAAGNQTLVSKIINENKLATESNRELINDLQKLAAQAVATREATRTGPNQQLLYPDTKKDEAAISGVLKEVENKNKELKQLDQQRSDDLADSIARDIAAEKTRGEEAERAAKQAAKAREQEAEQVSRQAEARDKLIARAEFEVDAAKRLADANDVSAEAYKRVQTEIEGERRVLEASSTLKGDELSIIEKLNIARAEQEQRILATNEARKEEEDLIRANKAFIEKIARDADKRKQAADREAASEAQKRARLLESQFEHMADVVTDTVAEGLQSAFDGDFDFTSLTESFGEAFKQTLSQTIAIGLTAPLNEAAKGFGQKLMASMGAGEPGQPGLGSLTGTEAGFAGAAGGYVAGGVYSQVAGLKPGNQAALGGAVGGALGAGVGLYFGGPGGAMVGGTVGAAAGSAIGGLFGGENNLGNDRSAQAYRSGKGIIYSDKSFSQENRDITQGILTEIQTLEEGFKDLGGTIGDVKLRIEAGNKTGITVNGKKYPDAQSALVASIEKLIGQTTGLSATQQTVLANTKGGTAAEIGADLAFGEQYDELVFNGREVDRVLQDLNKQFAAAARQAAELGLNTDLLAAAHQKAAQAVVDEYEAQRSDLRNQLASVGPDTVGQQFRALEIDFQDLAKAAANLNIPLEEVTAAHIRAGAALEQQIKSQQDSLNLQIAQLGGDDSIGTQLFALNVQVQELAKQATALGIPLDELALAHQRAAARIVEAAKVVDGAINDQTRRGVAEQIANARGDKSLPTQLHILETQMRDLAEAAKKVGIPLAEVTKAHKAAGAELQRQYEQSQRGVLSQIAAARGDNSLGTQLFALETQMRELAKAAADLGLNVNSVYDAHKIAAEKIKQADIELRRDFADQLRLLDTNSLDEALVTIHGRFRDLTAEAKELGIATAALVEAEAKAKDKAVEQNRRSKESLRLELRGFGAANDNDVSFALAQLNLQFKELEDRANDLLVPLAEVTAAHKRAADEIIEADREMRAKFLRDIKLIDATDLERELAGIRDRFKELIDQAVDLGYATDGLRKSQAKAEADAIEATRKRLTETERSLAGAQRDVFDQIDQFLTPLKQLLGPTGVGQGVYSGGATATDTLAEFRKTLALARSGDVGALQSIGGIGQSAIQAARVYGASGTQASAAFREVTEGFREIQGELEEKRTLLIKQGLDYQKLTLEETTRQRIEVVTELRELRAELKRSLDISRERKVS